MKDCLRIWGNLRKEGKHTDNLQADIKAENEKQKRDIRKRLNEQFSNRFGDEEEPQPEPEKPESDLYKYSSMSISYWWMMTS